MPDFTIPPPAPLVMLPLSKATTGGEVLKKLDVVTSRVRAAVPSSMAFWKSMAPTTVVLFAAAPFSPNCSKLPVGTKPPWPQVSFAPAPPRLTTTVAAVLLLKPPLPSQ